MMTVDDNSNTREDADEMLAHLDKSIATEENNELSPTQVEEQPNEEPGRALCSKMEI